MRQRQACQGIGSITDLPFTAHKDQNIPRCLVTQFVDRVDDRLRLIPLTVAIGNRPVAHLDRVGTPGDLNDGSLIEVARETLRIDGRRGDDHLQVWTLRQ